MPYPAGEAPIHMSAVCCHLWTACPCRKAGQHHTWEKMPPDQVASVWFVGHVSVRYGEDAGPRMLSQAMRFHCMPRLAVLRGSHFFGPAHRESGRR